MIILVEGIILCFLFTIMVLLMAKNPIKTSYNYPPKIQERVKSLKEYKNYWFHIKEGIIGEAIGIIICIIISLVVSFIL